MYVYYAYPLCMPPMYASYVCVLCIPTMYASLTHCTYLLHLFDHLLHLPVAQPSSYSTCYSCVAYMSRAQAWSSVHGDAYTMVSTALSWSRMGLGGMSWCGVEVG